MQTINFEFPSQHRSDCLKNFPSRDEIIHFSAYFSKFRKRLYTDLRSVSTYNPTRSFLRIQRPMVLYMPNYNFPTLLLEYSSTDKMSHFSKILEVSLHLLRVESKVHDPSDLPAKTNSARTLIILGIFLGFLI